MVSDHLNNSNDNQLSRNHVLENTYIEWAKLPIMVIIPVFEHWLVYACIRKTTCLQPLWYEVKNHQRLMVHALIIQHHVCRENLCRLGGSKFHLCSTFIDFLILLTQLASFSVIFFSGLALTSLLSRGLISMALVVPMVFQTSFLINIV